MCIWYTLKQFSTRECKREPLLHYDCLLEIVGFLLLWIAFWPIQLLQLVLLYLLFLPRPWSTIKPDFFVTLVFLCMWKFWDTVVTWLSTVKRLLIKLLFKKFSVLSVTEVIFLFFPAPQYKIIGNHLSPSINKCIKWLV